MAGAIFGFLGVGLGAFGAHILKEILTPDLLAIFETAVRYQMYHIAPIFFAGWFFDQFQHNWFRVSGKFFLAGISIFSGSLYLLVLTGIRTFGAITPLGGVSLLIGWLLLILAVKKQLVEN